MRIVLVAGARPNFMKVAPIHAALAADAAFEPILIHTGQHYDHSLSRVFFDELGLPEPDLDLGVGSDTQSRQTAAIMIAFEEVLKEYAPELVIVVGDVNSTFACALTAQRHRIPVAHVEAGLRSRDRDMPEEINRILTDHVSEWLYTSCEDAAPNLAEEGVPESRVVFVGNVMIDTLVQHVPAARREDVLERLGVAAGGYALTTLHRPSNVDDPEVLGGILGELMRLSTRMPVVFPVHPRTRQCLERFRPELDRHPAFRVMDPIGYLAFLRLTMDAGIVLTDSGGIQEETTYLGVPCLTLRENTERPITIEQGTNTLVGTRPDRIRTAIERALDGDRRKVTRPRRWDGKAAVRIARHIRRTFIEPRGTEKGRKWQRVDPRSG